MTVRRYEDLPRVIDAVPYKGPLDRDGMLIGKFRVRLPGGRHVCDVRVQVADASRRIPGKPARDDWSVRSVEQLTAAGNKPRVPWSMNDRDYWFPRVVSAVDAWINAHGWLEGGR